MPKGEHVARARSASFYTRDGRGTAQFGKWQRIDRRIRIRRGNYSEFREGRRGKCENRFGALKMHLERYRERNQAWQAAVKYTNINILTVARCRIDLSKRHF